MPTFSKFAGLLGASLGSSESLASDLDDMSLVDFLWMSGLLLRILVWPSWSSFVVSLWLRWIRYMTDGMAIPRPTRTMGVTLELVLDAGDWSAYALLPKGTRRETCWGRVRSSARECARAARIVNMLTCFVGLLGVGLGSLKAEYDQWEIGDSTARKETKD